MNISDPTIEQNIPAIWRQAFRPLFLVGAIFAIYSMSLWALFLHGNVLISPYGGMHFWHAHEMLFGFVAAIIAGFLLTAVQNWTGLRATHGKSLILLVVVWFTGRLLMLSNLTSLQWLTALVDMSFLLLCAILMAKLVINVNQYRNLIFVPLLLLIMTGNALTHLSVVLQTPEYYRWGMYSTVMTITLLISIIAGRVLPMFTANGTNTKRVHNLAWLETLTLGSTLTLTILQLANLPSDLPQGVAAGIFALAALAHSIRALRWRPQVTFSTPLVWSLHAAYWFIPVSFTLFTLHYLGINISSSTALHGLTAGAISSIILAMIARIALGHSGRALIPHTAMKYAFAFIILAGISRVCAQHLQIYSTFNVYILAAGTWILAYTIYLICYWRVLTSPRPDGRPG